MKNLSSKEAHKPRAVRGNNFVAAVTALVLGMMAVLIWLNHASNLERNRNTLEEFREDARKLASLIGYFLYERGNDIKNLADSRQVLTYFENKAMGVSPAYGLLASELALDEEFARLIHDRTIGNVRIYSRLALFDLGGNVIADVTAQGAKSRAERAAALPGNIAPGGGKGPAVSLDSSTTPAGLILSQPVPVNGRTAGQLLATLDFAAMLKQFDGDHHENANRVMCVANEDGPVAYLHGENAFDLAPLIAGRASPPGLERVRFGPDVARAKEAEGLYVVVRAPIEDSPLVIVSAIKEQELLGSIPLWLTTTALTALCLVICVCIYAVARAHYRNVSLERLKLLVENAGDAIYMTDMGGRLVEANQETEHQTGYTRRELLGMSLSDFDPDLTPRRFEELSRRLSHQGRASLETRHTRKDGASFPVDMSIVSLESEGNGFLLAIARDITERKRIEDELRNSIAERKRFESALIEAKDSAESASLAKSEFLANMSHEIRTPMTGVLGMLQLLETTRLDEEQKEYLAAAIGSAQRMTQLLVDILDLSRIEAGRLVMQKTPFEIARMEESVSGLFADMARRKGLDFEFSVDARIPPVLEGDETRLRQILFNIVGNAVKFTQSGRITVSATPLDQCDPSSCRILFVVEDTGAGIPDALLMVIFEPFVQGAGTIRRDFQGAGLGLAIVRKLVDLMGGSLCIANGEASGTAFYVSLPFGVSEVRKAQGRASPRRKPAESEAPLPSILLAEDEAVNAIAISRLLGKSGYKVTRAANGLEALELLSKQSFDVVLMDIQMPVMDGMEAAKTIRTSPEFRDMADIPVIAMTAYAMTGDRERFLAAGMDDYVSKPVDFNELKDAVARAARRSGARQP